MGIFPSTRIYDISVIRVLNRISNRLGMEYVGVCSIYLHITIYLSNGDGVVGEFCILTDIKLFSTPLVLDS